MNGYERYMSVLEKRPPDELPRIPILMQWAAEHIGSNYGAFAADYRVLVEANLRCAEEFGMDQVSCISDPYRETQGFGGEVTYVTDGVPRCTAPLEGSKDLNRLGRPQPLVSPRMLDRVQAVRAYRERAGRMYSVLGWVEGPAAEAADLRGVQDFMMDLMDDEAFACALMDRCLETAIDFARAQLEAGADTIGIGDAIASQVGGLLYGDFIFPREKRLVDAIHAAGGRVRLHICGNITPLLPRIAELGVDILDVDHMVSLSVARKAMGPDVVLAGNVDPVTILRGTPESIVAARERAYAEAGAPFMVNAGCEIPAGTPTGNVAAFCRPRPV